MFTIDFGVAAAAVDKEIRELVESMVAASRDAENEEEEEEVTKMRIELMNAMRGSWENVVEIYKRDPRSHTIKIGFLRDTALHMAIRSRKEDTAQKLVQQIIPTNHTPTEKDALYVLCTPNKDGNTPLHLAAALGSVNLCKSIIIGNRYKQVLLAARNQSSHSTPLYWAAFNGNKDGSIKCATPTPKPLTTAIHGMVPLLFTLPLKMAFGVRLLLQLSSSN